MAANRRAATEQPAGRCLLCAGAVYVRDGVRLQGLEEAVFFHRDCAARAAAELARDVDALAVRRMATFTPVSSEV